ncbi:MAG: hypothetical protein CL811_04700 [Colwelliaceae bacterium]|nr:hypothetical protein [Colwelliaceae bacterium]|tara:strand:+ start:2832 stop:3863 length:1032 start_codon:yes stop_codon:yes gene_type:complete
MNSKIKSYFENLNPKKLDLKNKVKVSQVKKIGMGTSNLNYLVIANKRKFVFRLNMDPKLRAKSKREFKALRMLEKYKIGPKAFSIDKSRKIFDSDLIIISYLEGKTVNKTSDYFKNKMIINIAKLCANLHLIKIQGKLKKLHKDNSIKGCNRYVKFLKKEYLIYINKNLRNKTLKKIIKDTYDDIIRNVPKSKYNSDLVLSQGDLCEQNVIVNKGKYKLIDFEDLELTDRASHLAHLLTDFGRTFEEDQKELFLNEYLKKIKVDRVELEEKINTWTPIKLFEIFLWSIKHTLRIKNNEMHSEFSKNDDMDNNLTYVETMFKKNIRFNVIDKKYKNFDIEKVLK